MSAGKAVIGQSGGPTAVINRSLVGFIKEALNHNFDEKDISDLFIEMRITEKAKISKQILV